jgi:hypothetical protein
MWSVSNRTGTSNSKSAVTSTPSAGGVPRDRLGDGPDLDHAAGRVVLDQLELGLGVIARPQQLAGGPVVGPVLEPEAVGLAPARPKERDQLVDLRRLLEPARDILAPARFRPVDVALLVSRASRHHRGRELRPQIGRFNPALSGHPRRDLQRLLPPTSPSAPIRLQAPSIRSLRDLGSGVRCLASIDHLNPPDLIELT